MTKAELLKALESLDDDAVIEIRIEGESLPIRSAGPDWTSEDGESMIDDKKAGIIEACV